MKLIELKNKTVNAGELALVELVERLAVEEYKEKTFSETAKKVSDVFKDLKIPSHKNDPWIGGELRDLQDTIQTCFSKLRDIFGQ